MLHLYPDEVERRGQRLGNGRVRESYTSSQADLPALHLIYKRRILSHRLPSNVVSVPSATSVPPILAVPYVPAARRSKARARSTTGQSTSIPSARSSPAGSGCGQTVSYRLTVFGSLSNVL